MTGTTKSSGVASDRGATSRSETPFWVRVDREDLFGIVTTPTKPPNGTAVILAQGVSGAPSFGRNRLWTDLARKWAGLGFHTVRFAFRTMGESTGVNEDYHLARPFAADVLAVVNWTLEQPGVERVVLAGTCFGARSQIEAASAIDPLAGVIGIPTPVRDVGRGEHFASYPLRWFLRRLLTSGPWKKVFRLRRWRQFRKLLTKKWRRYRRLTPAEVSAENTLDFSSRLLGQLTELSDRDVPVVLAYGRQDVLWEDVQRGLQGELGALCRHSETIIVEQFTDTKIHGLINLEAQQLVADRVERFLLDVVNRHGEPPPGSKQKP